MGQGGGNRHPLHAAPALGPDQPAQPLPAPTPARVPVERLLRRTTASVPTTTLSLAPDPHEALRTANAHMDRRRFEKLRRGRVEPEARLDLHGMTSDEAHRTLTEFILTAAALDRRLVLIITGKGRADDAGGTAAPWHPAPQPAALAVGATAVGAHPAGCRGPFPARRLRRLLRVPAAAPLIASRHGR